MSIKILTTIIVFLLLIPFTLGTPEQMGHPCNEVDTPNCNQIISSTTSTSSSATIKGTNNYANSEAKAIEGHSISGEGIYGTGVIGVYGEGNTYGLYTPDRLGVEGNRFRFGNFDYEDEAWFTTGGSGEEDRTMGFNSDKDILIKNNLYLINGQICEGWSGPCYYLSALGGTPSLWIPTTYGIYYLGGLIGVGTSTPTKELEIDGNLKTTNMIIIPTGIEKGINYTSNEISLGTSSSATGSNAIAIGFNSNAPGDFSIALGPNTNAQTNSIAIGNNAQATGENSVAVGSSASATGSAAHPPGRGRCRQKAGLGGATGGK